MNSQSSLPCDTRGLHTTDIFTQLFSSCTCKKPQTRQDEVYTTFRGKMTLQITTKTFQTLWEVFSFFLKLIYVLCQCKKHQCSCCSVCSQNNAYVFFLLYVVRLQFFSFGWLCQPRCTQVTSTRTMVFCTLCLAQVSGS